MRGKFSAPMRAAISSFCGLLRSRHKAVDGANSEDLA
jgi:hypothetical protein